MSLMKRWIDWLRLRFAVRQIEEHVIYHRVVKEPWYYGEGAALVLLVAVLIGTGAFLALTYSPSPSTAYQSMVQLTERSQLGWFLRGLHYWSAGAMVILLLYHMFRHIVLGGYLPPREGIWLVGVILFFLVIINSFTGYTLRWDERAVYAIRVALNMFYSVPIIGDGLVRFVQGGGSINANTLSRFYAVHVIFVPLALVALIGYHLYLVIIYGVTTLAEREEAPGHAHEQIRLRDQVKHSEDEGADFYPYTAAKSGIFAVAVFLIVITTSIVLGPRELGPEANFVENSIPREEWWFHWYSGLIAYLPPWLAPAIYVALPIAIFIALVALPFLDSASNRGARRRPLAIIGVSLILVVLFAFTSLRLSSPWTAWPTTELPPLPPGQELTESVHQGRALFTEYGCHNCHAIGGQGSSFGPNLTGYERRLSPDELRSVILEPPSDYAMPAYRDRITEDDLQRLVEFVLVAQTFPRQF